MLIGLNTQAQAASATNELTATNYTPGTDAPMSETNDLLWGVNWEDPQATTQGIITTYYGGLNAGTISADDFEIPEGETWIISSIWARGFLSQGVPQPEGFGYTIYSDDDGEPGTVLFEETFLGTFDVTFVQLDLTEAITMDEGIYWIAIYAHYATASTTAQGRWNQYMWNPSPMPLDEPMLRDYANLFGMAADGWVDFSSILNPTFDGLDFAIWGEIYVPTPPPTYLYENWDSYYDFTTNLEPWITIDVQGEPTWTASGFNFPGEGDPFAFMAFNPGQTMPPIVDDHPAVDGDKYAVAIQSQIIGDNKWLISPRLLGTETTELSFYAKSITADYGLERFRVLISTTGTDPEDFTLISDGDYLEAPTEWTMFDFDLSAYDGQEFHFAIQYVSHDAFIFMLDAILVNEETTGNRIFASEIQTKIFPNPAVNSMMVRSDNIINGIKVFDLAGRQVINQIVDGKNITIDVSSLNNGLYILQVISENSFESHKIQIIR